MHEAAVCTEVMDIVLRVAEDNAFNRVERIVVAAGPHSCLNEQELNFYFSVVQRDTIMDGAWITVMEDHALEGISQMYVRSIEGE